MQKKTMQELNRLDADTFKTTDKTQIILVLDDVRSMNNVGSVFRTADCFGLEAVYLCGYTPAPPHRDIEKTALGATETVRWQKFETITTCLENLKQHGFQIISIEQVHNSISLEKYTIDKNQKYALVLGNEVNGVSEEAIQASNASIELPQDGTKHSLNISVCAGIVAWEFKKYMAL